MVQPAERVTVTAPRSRKQRTEAAIQAALRGDWKRAADENRGLLKDDPRDVEAANRLGKALTELGQKKQAIEAYRQALAVDPANPIARKNIARLEEAKGGRAAKPKRTAEVPPELARPATSLIEASDRAAEFILQQPNWKELSKLEPGEPAQLEPNPRGVAVKAVSGELLGYVEPRAGLRLRRMIEGGNRYAVVIRSISKDAGAVVLIRETYKHPSMVGQASFLQAPSARRRVMRAYTKSVVRYDRDLDFDVDAEESEEPLADAWRPRRAAAPDTDEEGFDGARFDEPADLADEELEVDGGDEEAEEEEESDD
jgi:tetratricopeptide (TPR) repeat protein